MTVSHARTEGEQVWTSDDDEVLALQILFGRTQFNDACVSDHSIQTSDELFQPLGTPGVPGKSQR